MAMLRFSLAGVTALIGCLLVAPIAFGALVFGGFTSVTRLFVRFFEPRFARWDELIEFEPEVGWKSQANIRTYHLAEDVYRVTTALDGWRGELSLADSEIVVFGDSFAWGHGIDDENFFSNLTGAVRIKSIGCNGYNMVQELLWMRRSAPQLKGKTVVWFIYFGNDLYDNLTPEIAGYRAPFVRTLDNTDEWQIVSNHVRPENWFCTPRANGRGPDYYGKLANLCSRSAFTDRAYAACEYLLREGRDLCKNSGAELVVMTIPDVTQMTEQGRSLLLKRGGDPGSFDPGFPDERITAICAKLGVQVVRLRDYLSPADYKVSGDCHWNANGHRKVADLLAQLFTEQRRSQTLYY
jgi:hypothetical protein